MPLYDAQCEECGRVFEHFCKISEMDDIRCSCGGRAETLISHTDKNRDWFRPHWNENFDTDPVFVKSRRHMKDLCLQHNVTSRALGDVRNIREV